jgi:hypothetical protein
VGAVKLKILFIFLMLFVSKIWAQQENLRDTNALVSETDTVIIPKKLHSKFSLLDSIRNPHLIRKQLFKNESITRIIFQEEVELRDLPSIKQIQYRNRRQGNWKFWAISIIIFFLAAVRLFNIKRFDAIILAATDMGLNVKSWLEKGPNYLVTSLLIFVGFVGSLSLFAVSYAERRGLIEKIDDFQVFWKIAGFITAVYIGKIVLNFMVGALFKMLDLATLMVFNAVSINNLIGLLLLAFNLMYIYVPGYETSRIIAALAIIVILVGFIFRTLKNLLLGMDAMKYPTIYLFTYLCAFEIFPWFIVFKLYLNTWFN